jgi:hypothetical protein
MAVIEEPDDILVDPSNVGVPKKYDLEVGYPTGQSSHSLLTKLN